MSKLLGSGIIMNKIKPNSKSQNRNSKQIRNHKLEIRNRKFLFQIWYFVLRICLGFRASYLGFKTKVMLPAFVLSLVVPGVALAQQQKAIIVDENTGRDIPKAIPVPESPFRNPNIQNSQAAGAVSGVGASASFGGGAGGAAGALGGCAAGQLAASGIRNFISTSLGSVISNPTVVPTNPVTLTQKEAGSITSLGVSWDAVGFCLVNSIIQYIGDSTVAWINRGFQGNPVFVDDPEQFFADIADIEAGAFLGELSGGFLCSPFELDVRLQLAENYNSKVSPYATRGRCTFSGISGNIEQFVSGETFSWDDWLSFSSGNNPLGSLYSAEIELGNRINARSSTQIKLLDWGRGFLSFPDPNTGKITSPGAIIEGQLNNRLGNSEQRLLIADEFDEIVNALVNQLIKVALNEVTGSLGN
jgi:hypothetical protein